MHSKIAVLIPCYNESTTISKVITDYKVVLPEADIYVYDNNSTDGSADIARSVGAIVENELRQGKGNVIRSMFRDIQADCYLMVDGDDTYPPEYAKEMTRLVIEEKMDMVVGDRLSATYFTENKRLFHNGGNLLVRKLVNSLFKGNISDIMSGYRAFSPTFVKSYPVVHQGFEIETDMTIFALDKNLVVSSIPVDYRDRPKGSVSKLNTVSDGIRVLKTIFQLYKDYRPLSFFGIISVVFLLLGIGFAIPVLFTYFHTGLVPRLPTLIATVFFVLTAIETFCCGLILDTEAKNNRKLFELHLIQISSNSSHILKKSSTSTQNSTFSNMLNAVIFRHISRIKCKKIP